MSNNLDTFFFYNANYIFLFQYLHEYYIYLNANKYYEPIFFFFDLFLSVPNNIFFSTL